MRFEVLYGDESMNAVFLDYDNVCYDDTCSPTFRRKVSPPFFTETTVSPTVDKRKKQTSVWATVLRVTWSE
jgi:hypothetical protein